MLCSLMIKLFYLKFKTTTVLGCLDQTERVELLSLSHGCRFTSSIVFLKDTIFLLFGSNALIIANAIAATGIEPVHFLLSKM